MTVVIRKLLGIGKLPDDLREQLETEGLIHVVDYVAVTRRFSGSIPGMRSPHSVASYVGAVALTSQRVLATLSALPKLAGRTVDVRWDQPQGGAATATITESGCRSRSTRRGRPALPRPAGIGLQDRAARRGARPATDPDADVRRAAGVRVPGGRCRLSPVTALLHLVATWPPLPTMAP